MAKGEIICTCNKVESFGHKIGSESEDGNMQRVQRSQIIIRVQIKESGDTASMTVLKVFVTCSSAESPVC